MKRRRSVLWTHFSTTFCQVTHYNTIYVLSDLVNMYSVSTGPGPGPLQSNMASVWCWNIFWTGLGLYAAFALLFLFISYKPQKKKVIDITASIGWLSYVVERKCMCAAFSANSNLMLAYIASLIWFSSTRSKLLMFLNRYRSICGSLTMYVLSDLVNSVYMSLGHLLI